MRGAVGRWGLGVGVAGFGAVAGAGGGRRGGVLPGGREVTAGRDWRGA
ncbi:hypothetical protein [Amycolatopsis sacchari]